VKEGGKDRIKSLGTKIKRTLIEERELCQKFVSNFPLCKANSRIVDAEASVNSDTFIMGLPKMRVLNLAKVGQTHTK
jgi:hypothetical protein